MISVMAKELDTRELFDLVAAEGEVFNHEWEDAVDELVTREGRLVGLRAPGVAGEAGPDAEIHIYRFRGVYVAYDDDGAYGPFKSFDDAAVAVSLTAPGDAATRIWVAEDR
jgi:hypothetical protein